MCNKDRKVFDPSDKAKELVGKMVSALTVEDMVDLADLLDEGGDIEVHDALIEKVIEMDPSKASDYVITSVVSKDITQSIRINPLTHQIVEG